MHLQVQKANRVVQQDETVSEADAVQEVPYLTNHVSGYYDL